MKVLVIYITIVILGVFLNCGTSKARVIQKSSFKYYAETNQLLNITNNPPIAINDTFILLTGCNNNNTISGNILLNDFDPDGDEIELYYIVTPKVGEFVISDNGEFTYTAQHIPFGNVPDKHLIQGKDHFLFVHAHL